MLDMVQVIYGTCSKLKQTAAFPHEWAGGREVWGGGSTLHLIWLEGFKCVSARYRHEGIQTPTQYARSLSDFNKIRYRPCPEVTFKLVQYLVRVWGSVVVKVLRYKSEGPGIDSRCRRDFSCGI